MKKRQVYIDDAVKNGKRVAYFVRYAVRRKHQHHCAAQFDAGAGIERVKQWIAGQNNLELIEKPEVDSTTNRS